MHGSSAQNDDGSPKKSGDAIPLPKKTPPPRLGNRVQILLFAIGTILLTGLIVAGFSLYFVKSRVLTLAVGPRGSVEEQFAQKLAALVEANSRELRLQLVAVENFDQAAAKLSRREADLAILRTDGKIPAPARAVAILERDLLVQVARRGSKIGSTADLKNKTIVLLNGDAGYAALGAKILEVAGAEKAKITAQAPAPDLPIDTLLAPGKFNAALVVLPLSAIERTHRFQMLFKQAGSFEIDSFGDAKTLERRIPGVFSETISEGQLSQTPKVPDDDLEVTSIQEILVARNKLSDTKIAELAGIIFENKANLAVEASYATKIESPDTDKDAFIVAHKGVNEYLDDDIKSFLDKYSDLIYLVMSIGGVLGSASIAIYTSLTRVSPKEATILAQDLLELHERIAAANSLQSLELCEVALDGLLTHMLEGLKDKTITTRGLDGFRLGYELARNTILTKREKLERAAGMATTKSIAVAETTELS